MLLIMGALLSFTTVYCIKKNSATTYSMTGAVNKVPTTLLGAVAFRQYPSFLASIGIVVSIIGGAGYAFFKAREDHQEKRHELETVSVAVTSKIPYTTLRDRSDSTSRDKPR
jgi:drug/metabolite transporter (DMT)-like permease